MQESQVNNYRFFQNVAAYLPLVRRVQWWALGIGLVCGTGFVVWRSTSVNPMEPSVWRILGLTGYVLGRISIMLFYVATIIRAVCNERWRQRLAPITLAGRMPLTNYLLQTLIGITLSITGPRRRAKSGRAGLVLAVAIFFFLVHADPLVAEHAPAGPMEHSGAC
jgi:uncharacterized membrane protein YeiB